MRWSLYKSYLTFIRPLCLHYIAQLYVSRGKPGSLPGYWNSADNKFYVYNSSTTELLPFTVQASSIADLPIVVPMGRYYGLMWNTLSDIQNMRIRLSEPDYLNITSPNEWVGFNMGWLGKRYSMNFIYPSDGSTDWGSLPHAGQVIVPPVPRNTFPNVHACAFGTASLPGGAKNNSMTVILNANITRLSKRFSMTSRATGQLAGSATSYTLDMTYSLCPPEGCYKVPSGKLGAPVLWSKTFTTTLKSGQDLTLDPSQYILLDVNPPPLGTLTIFGRLEFYNSTRVKDIKLTVKNIIVFGSLAIGTKTAPFAGNATITLTGSVTDDDITVDSSQVLGHKAIAIFGNVTMFGSKPSIKSWTRLATTANAQSSQIVVTDNPGWKIGSSIVISMTEYSKAYRNQTQVSCDLLKFLRVFIALYPFLTSRSTLCGPS